MLLEIGDRNLACFVMGVTVLRLLKMVVRRSGTAVHV